MDDRQFDAFVRQLASGRSRRSLLKGLLGMGGAALAGTAAAGPVSAARRPAPTPNPIVCPGTQQWNGSACICASGTMCGPACCGGGSVCCDNACCHGECYSEELCCPTGQVVCKGDCCAPGEVCFQGACGRCAICGDDCCSGDTPLCCLNGDISTCAFAGSTCCTADADCRSLDFCDGDVAHTYACVNAVCTESTQSCQGTDPCYEYGCAQGTCTATRIAGCCTSVDQCAAVDSCTPAACLENHTCNTVSNCASGEHCCSDGTCSQGGTCGPAGCTVDGVFFPPCVTDCPTCVAPDGGTVCGCAAVTSTPCTSTDMCQQLNTSWICVGPPGSSICAYPTSPNNGG